MFNFFVNFAGHDMVTDAGWATAQGENMGFT